VEKLNRYVEEVLSATSLTGQARDELRAEMLSHLWEVQRHYLNQGFDQEESFSLAVRDFGAPAEIGRCFAQAEPPEITTQGLKLLYRNITFFILGIAVTLFLGWLPQDLQARTWQGLLALFPLLAVVYLGFWVYNGYRAGRKFGPHPGWKVLLVALMAMAPNWALLYLILFSEVDPQIFGGILIPPVIVLCALGTAGLPWLTSLGFHLGKKKFFE